MVQRQVWVLESLHSIGKKARCHSLLQLQEEILQAPHHLAFLAVASNHHEESMPGTRTDGARYSHSVVIWLAISNSTMRPYDIPPTDPPAEYVPS